MKVYHYTSPESWKDIKKGSWQSKHKPGLGASRRVGRIHMEAWNTVAAFALLEPLPQNWTHNDKFPDIWDHFKKDIGKILLEIEVQEEDPNVFVIDRGEIEKFLYNKAEKQTEEEKQKNRELAEGNYIGSRVPLFTYLKNIENYPFVLPEVIFIEDIPLERISISSEQPLLHEYIERWKVGSEYEKRAIRDVVDIPELRVWYETKYLPQKEKEKPASEFHRKLR